MEDMDFDKGDAYIQPNGAGIMKLANNKNK